MTDAELRQWMLRVYEDCGASPDFLHFDPDFHRVLLREQEAAERVDRVCSPAGLRDLFPGVRT